MAAMQWLPQSPDSDEWAKELHDRIEEAERRLISPNLILEEYEDGTASGPDELVTVRSQVETPAC